MLTQGSKEHPVQLDMFQRIKEVHWGPGYNALEILYPDDAGYDIKKGDENESFTFTPVSGALKVGDKITDKVGWEEEEPIVNVVFAEENPIGPEVGGKWVWGFWYMTPVLMKPIPIEVVDRVTPNPFHDQDQAAIDAWEAYWTNIFQLEYNQNVEGLSRAIAAFQASHENQLTRIVTISRRSEGAKGGDYTGSDTYLYNTDDAQYISDLFPFFNGPLAEISLSRDLIYRLAETTLAAPAGSPGLTTHSKPVQTSMVEGDYWSPIHRRRDVFLLKKKFLTEKRDIVLSRKSGSTDGVQDAEITYYQGCSGDFTVAAGRKVVFGQVVKTTVKSVACDGNLGTILASFDANGFV